MKRDNAKLIEDVHAVEDLVAHTAPGRNDHALRQVEHLCFRLNGHEDSYVRSKAGSLRGHAQNYFSVRKHKKWPEGAVRGLILNDCLQLTKALQEDQR